MSFTFSVVGLAEKQLTGICVQTDMASAMADCPKLWERFAPLMCGELAKHPAVIRNTSSYGVSQFIDENKFIYWSVVEVSSTADLPNDVQILQIPAARYIKCTAPSLSNLSEAYEALNEWMSAQERYAYDMSGFAIEEYAFGWQMTDSIEIYAAVVEK